MTDPSIRIYEPAVTEGFEWALPADPADYEVFASFDGTSRSANWTPVPMTLLTEDEGRTFEESDMPWLGGHALVLRERAVEVLGPMLLGEGELLPLACDDAELWVLNVLQVIDALDEDRSKIVRFSTGRIMAIEEHSFRREPLENVTIFKIPQMLRGSTFVNEDFVRLVQSSELRGADFKLVWEDTLPTN